MHGRGCEKRGDWEFHWMLSLTYSHPLHFSHFLLSLSPGLSCRASWQVLALWTVVFFKAQDNLTGCVATTWPRKAQNIKHRLSKPCIVSLCPFLFCHEFLPPLQLQLIGVRKSQNVGPWRLCVCVHWRCVNVRWNTAAECLLWQGNEWDRPEATGHGEKETHAHCGTDTQSYTYTTWKSWITCQLEPHIHFLTHNSNKQTWTKVFLGTELEPFLKSESKPNRGLKYVIELPWRDKRGGKLSQTVKRVYCHRQKSW